VTSAREQRRPAPCSRETLKKLFGMFYPLSRSECARWTNILFSSENHYLSALEDEACYLGLRQTVNDGVVV
jgi:hypothetical protein